MENIKIMTDSASDISAADEQRYGISILPRRQNAVVNEI